MNTEQTSKNIFTYTNYVCWPYKGTHKDSFCDKSKQALIEMRSALVKEFVLCFNWLSNDHMLHRCKLKFLCRIEGG